MFGRPINLFKLFGFQVRIDLSWIFIAVFLAWSLAVGYFPFHYRNLSAAAYWIMGVIGALGLFSSIILHEISHSLAALRFGIPMKGITLFIFGGVSEMDEEPPNPRAEFTMAVMGPLSSVLLGLLSFGIYSLGVIGRWPEAVNGVVHYFAWMNGLLAGFNLLPAFPMDGGRMLRSILWALKGDFRWATRIASSVGSGFGFLLIAVGMIKVMAGDFIGGMWWFLIGIFLQSSAKKSYQQLMIRKALEGEHVRRFMVSDPVTVQPSVKVQQLVEDYIYRYHFKMFPVVDSSELLGCVTTKQVQETPREKWNEKTAGDLATACSGDNTIEPDADAMEALSKMSRGGSSRLIVLEEGRLIGVITLKDMVKFLTLKLQLGQ